MSTSAVKILDFFSKYNEITIKRYEVASDAFSILRHNTRLIAFNLHDSENPEAQDLSVHLRILLSKWLSVPLPFDSNIRKTLTEMFGNAEAVERKWGTDIRGYYDTALAAAEDLTNSESPVRTILKEIIEELTDSDKKFKIYCHKRAREYYDSIIASSQNPQGQEDMYLHTIKDYRETNQYETLIKLGPLRSKGWAAVPDAVLNSPRFRTLRQVVWSGCKDEEDFGYDPVSSYSEKGSEAVCTPPKNEQNGTGTSINQVLKVYSYIQHDSTDDEVPEDIDELQEFREYFRPGADRQAVLLQIDHNLGILYPPNSKILSYNPNGRSPHPISERIPGDTLHEGMYLITPLLDDSDFDGVQAKHGQYSRAWKNKLRTRFNEDESGLIENLKKNGLNLAYLRNAIKHWCQPPSTVIHAPQLRNHFEVLLETIGFNNQDVDKKQSSDSRLWYAAWNEIRRSRGEAIQAGVHAHEERIGELIEMVKDFIPEIRKKASNQNSFKLDIPDTYELHGLLLFLKIIDIEAGFKAPETELKRFCDLNEIDKWRD